MTYPTPRSIAGASSATASGATAVARLLRGMSCEGIGADFALSTATVETYYNRAFERLGIHHRNELFALALQTAP